MINKKSILISIIILLVVMIIVFLGNFLINNDNTSIEGSWETLEKNETKN